MRAVSEMTLASKGGPDGGITSDDTRGAIQPIISTGMVSSGLLARGPSTAALHQRWGSPWEFVVDGVLEAPDLRRFRMGGVDRGERLGQRVEIAGKLQPAVPHAFGRPRQHPPARGVGLGNAVDIGGDLYVDRFGRLPFVAGDLDAKGEVAHRGTIDDWDLVGSSANAIRHQRKFHARTGVPSRACARQKKIRINLLKLPESDVAKQAITGRVTGDGRRIGYCFNHRRGRSGKRIETRAKICTIYVL